MSVTVERLRSGNLDVAVVSGLAHEQALAQLCSSLREGVAFDAARLMVVDVSNVSPVSDESVDALRRTATEMARRGRWLAIVDSRRPQLATAASAAVSYADVPAAVRASRRYFRLVAGGGERSILREITGIAVTVAQIGFDVVTQTLPRLVRRSSHG